jgi:hypothetical protein
LACSGTPARKQRHAAGGLATRCRQSPGAQVARACFWIQASKVGIARGSDGGVSSSPWPASGNSTTVKSLPFVLRRRWRVAALFSAGCERSWRPYTQIPGTVISSRRGTGSKPAGCSSPVISAFFSFVRGGGLAASSPASSLHCSSSCVVPAGLARAEEPDTRAVDLRPPAHSVHGAVGVGGEQVEVALVAWAASALRLAHAALVVGEERDPRVDNLHHPGHIPPPPRRLAAAVHIDDGGKRTGALRQVERAAEDRADAAEMNLDLGVVREDDLVAEGDIRGVAARRLGIVDGAPARGQRDDRRRQHHRRLEP